MMFCMLKMLFYYLLNIQSKISLVTTLLLCSKNYLTMNLPITKISKYQATIQFEKQNANKKASRS